MTKLPLDTVRQFYMEDVVLADTTLNPDDVELERKVQVYLKEKIDQLLVKAGT